MPLCTTISLVLTELVGINKRYCVNLWHKNRKILRRDNSRIARTDNKKIWK